MQRSKILIPILVSIAALGCRNLGYEKTRSGLEYKIFRTGSSKDTLKHGQYVKMNIKYTYNDSLLGGTYDFIPGYDMVDSVGRYHDFSELISKMRAGDSAVCFQLYDTMFAKNPMGMPPFMKKGTKVKTTFKILSAFETRDQAVADYDAELEKYRSAEMAVIEKYLSVNKINAEKVNNSVYVEVQRQGEGPVADSGKLVGVMYTGYNLEGKAFDSNVDSTKQVQKHPMDTFFFASKQAGAIPGMLEGITRFRKGGKGRLFIPSLMAYGPQGSPPAIKPKENLMFEIDVVEVKDMPSQPAGPMMPQPQ